MKSTVKLTFLAILGVVLFTNCSLDGECYNQLEVPIIRFEMPDSVLVGSTTEINVVFVTYSNCSQFNGLYEASSGDTISLHVIADYVGCTCPEELPDSTVVYKFTAAAVRNYIFRAWKYDNTVLQDTLVVYANEQ